MSRNKNTHNSPRGGGDSVTTPLIAGLTVISIGATSLFAYIDVNNTKQENSAAKTYIEADGFPVKDMPLSFGEVFGDVSTARQTDTVLDFGPCSIRIKPNKTFSASGDVIGVQDYPFASRGGEHAVVQDRQEFDAKFGPEPCGQLLDTETN